MNDKYKEWLASVSDAAGKDAEFAAGSEWLDTRLLVRIGATACWFKIYRGRIIDAMGYDTSGNRLGYDVVVAGSADAWKRIVRENSPFGREHATGFMSVDGNRTEGDRSYRAIVALADRVIRQCGLPPQEQ